MKDRELHSTCGISQFKFDSLNFHFRNLSCDKPLITVVIHFCVNFNMYFYPDPKYAGDKSRTSTLPGTNSNTLISNLPGTKTISNSKELKFFFTNLYDCSFINIVQHRYTMNRITHKDISIGLTVFSAFLIELIFFLFVFFSCFIVSIITRT